MDAGFNLITKFTAGNFMIISDTYGITSGRCVGTGKDGSISGARMIISTM